MNLQQAATVLQEIADDMARDAKSFDGRPFNGRTVAEYFGNQGAAIAAVANIVKRLIEGPLTNGEAQGSRGITD